MVVNPSALVLIFYIDSFLKRKQLFLPSQETAYIITSHNDVIDDVRKLRVLCCLRVDSPSRTPIYDIGFVPFNFSRSKISILVHVTRDIPSNCGLFRINLSSVLGSEFSLLTQTALLRLDLFSDQVRLNLLNFRHWSRFLSLLSIQITVLFDQIQSHHITAQIDHILWFCYQLALANWFIPLLNWSIITSLRHVMLTTKVVFTKNMTRIIPHRLRIRLPLNLNCFTFRLLIRLLPPSLLKILTHQLLSLFLHHLHTNRSVLLSVYLLSSLNYRVVFTHCILVLNRKNLLKTTQMFILIFISQPLRLSQHLFPLLPLIYLPFSCQQSSLVEFFRAIK